MDEEKSFWTSVPGILTGGAAFLTAAASLYTSIWSTETAVKPQQEQHQPQKVVVVEPAKVAPKSESPSSSKLFALEAVINDPDGYTNIRSMKSSSSSIVARVNRDEHFYTHQQDGSWWQVKTADGKVGYMHVSRIKLLSGQ